MIFDEFHERNLNGDLRLALVLDAQANLREDLRILVERWFALDPHLGLLILQSRQQVWTPVGEFSDNRHEVGLAAGLGLLFRPTRHLYLGGGVDCWGGSVHCDVLA